MSKEKRTETSKWPFCGDNYFDQSVYRKVRAVWVTRVATGARCHACFLIPESCLAKCQKITSRRCLTWSAWICKKLTTTTTTTTSEYLRLVDSRLFNRIRSPSHCLSHLLQPEKRHLGLRPRGHSYTLPICPNNLCKSSFIPRCLFCFLWLLTVFSITVFSVLFCCNICVCHLF